MSEWNNHKTYTAIALANHCHAHTQTKSVESFSPTAECRRSLSSQATGKFLRLEMMQVKQRLMKLTTLTVVNVDNTVKKKTTTGENSMTPVATNLMKSHFKRRFQQSIRHLLKIYQIQSLRNPQISLQS